MAGVIFLVYNVKILASPYRFCLLPSIIAFGRVLYPTTDKLLDIKQICPWMKYIFGQNLPHINQEHNCLFNLQILELIMEKRNS